MRLLDTSVWVEFFKASEKGAKVKQVLEKEEVCTSAITLAEITKWCVENKGNVDFILNQVKNNSIIIAIEEEILVEAGRVYGKMRTMSPKISLIDVIIYVSARKHDLMLWTTDKDFKNLPEVELL